MHSEQQHEGGGWVVGARFVGVPFAEWMRRLFDVSYRLMALVWLTQPYDKLLVTDTKNLSDRKSLYQRKSHTIMSKLHVCVGDGHKSVCITWHALRDAKRRWINVRTLVLVYTCARPREEDEIQNFSELRMIMHMNMNWIQVTETHVYNSLSEMRTHHANVIRGTVSTRSGVYINSD